MVQNVSLLAITTWRFPAPRGAEILRVTIANSIKMFHEVLHGGDESDNPYVNHVRRVEQMG